MVWDKLEKYYKTYKSDKLPIDKNTFTKTLRNSKYFIDYKAVKFKIYEEAVDGSKHATLKNKRAYILKASLLSSLNIENLIDVEAKKDGQAIRKQINKAKKKGKK